MVTRSAIPTIAAFAGAAAVLLVAASILLGEPGVPDEGASVARTVGLAVPPPARDPVQRAALPAPPAAASAPASAASTAVPVDPFKAFLDARRDNAAASAAPPPTLATPVDPFRAAVEAGRRPEPVPLVSPFGAAR